MYKETDKGPFPTINPDTDMDSLNDARRFTIDDVSICLKGEHGITSDRGRKLSRPRPNTYTSDKSVDIFHIGIPWHRNENDDFEFDSIMVGPKKLIAQSLPTTNQV